MKFDQQWVFEKSTSSIGFHYFNKDIIYLKDLTNLTMLYSQNQLKSHRLKLFIVVAYNTSGLCNKSFTILNYDRKVCFSLQRTL